MIKNEIRLNDIRDKNSSRCRVSGPCNSDNVRLIKGKMKYADTIKTANITVSRISFNLYMMNIFRVCIWNTALSPLLIELRSAEESQSRVRIPIHPKIELRRMIISSSSSMEPSMDCVVSFGGSILNINSSIVEESVACTINSFTTYTATRQRGTRYITILNAMPDEMRNIWWSPSLSANSSIVLYAVTVTFLISGQAVLSIFNPKNFFL